MATVKIELDKRYKTTDGTFPVKIRIIHDRKSRRYSTELKFTQDDWICVNKPNVREALKEPRSKLNQLRVELDGIMDNIGSSFSFEEFEKIYLGKVSANNKDFIEYYFRASMYELEQEKRVRTADSYLTAMKSILKYRPELKCKEITAEFLKGYEKWMISRGRSITTVGIHLRSLKVMVNYAIDDGAMSRDNYPFGKTSRKKYRVPQGRNHKRSIDPELVKKIRKFKAGGTVSFYRDMWVFCFFCGGMNIIDLMNLKYENIEGDFIKYQRQKTARTAPDASPIRIPIIPEVREIIDRWANKKVNDQTYLFPTQMKKGLSPRQVLTAKDTFNRLLNRHIECVAYAVGSKEKISYMHARHSFATVMKNAGQPIEMISEYMGHQSIKTTRDYLSGFYDEQKVKSSKTLAKAVSF